MLTEHELEHYVLAWQLPRSGAEYIRAVRTSPPARAVQAGGKNNMAFNLPSDKIHLTVQAESAAERDYLVNAHYSDDSLEEWDQPTPLAIHCTNKRGHRYPRQYHSDYLSLRRSGPCLVEVKPESVLRKLLETRPSEWVRTEGHARFLPAAEAAERLGIRHLVHSTADISTIRTANYRHLLAARAHNDLVSSSLRTAVATAFHNTAVISLDFLADQVGIDIFTPLLQLIDRQELYADLDNCLLGDPKTVLLVRHKCLLDTELMVRQSTLPFSRSDHAETTRFARQPSDKEALRALRRLEQVAADPHSRTARRCRALIRIGAERGLSQFQSLLPNFRNSGCREPRLAETVEAFLQLSITESYGNSKRRSPAAAYADYRAGAETAHPEHPPVSMQTFRRRIIDADPEYIAQLRGGRRARNAARNPSPVSTRQVPALLPFERAGIDHYLANILVVISKSARKLLVARPHVTTLRDYATLAILASWLSLRRPSRRAVGIVLRRCVRTYGHLPRDLYVDGGPEFCGPYLLSLLAHHGVTRAQHGADDGRSGSEIERCFSQMQSQWLPHVVGNTNNIKTLRGISRTHQPSEVAALTIHGAWRDLNTFCQWQNSTCQGERQESPMEALTTGLRRHPHIAVPVTYDSDFVLETAVDYAQYTVDPRKGVHFENRWYTHPALYLGSRRRRPQIRIEPENPYLIYARPARDWIPCLANGYDQFCMAAESVQVPEAIRLLDGRRFRTVAKVDDQVTLVRALHESEEMDLITDRLEANSPDAAYEYPEDSMFSEVRGLPVNTDTTYNDEIFNNAVAIIRNRTR